MSSEWHIWYRNDTIISNTYMNKKNADKTAKKNQYKYTCKYRIIHTIV